MVSVVGVAFHCARRDRVLLRDIFRFGTATLSSPSSCGSPRRGRRGPGPCSAAHRGSSDSCWCPGSSASRAPHSEHRPGQSSRHTGWNGSAGTTASRSAGSRSIRSPSSSRDVVVVALRPRACPGRRTAPEVDVSSGSSTSSRHRTHSPAAAPAYRSGDEHALHHGLEPQLQLEVGAGGNADHVGAEIVAVPARCVRTFRIDPGRRPSSRVSSTNGDRGSGRMVRSSQRQTDQIPAPA